MMQTWGEVCASRKSADFNRRFLSSYLIAEDPSSVFRRCLTFCVQLKAIFQISWKFSSCSWRCFSFSCWQDPPHPFYTILLDSNSILHVFVLCLASSLGIPYEYYMHVILKHSICSCTLFLEFWDFILANWTGSENESRLKMIKARISFHNFTVE